MSALRWTVQNAARLNIDSSRIAVGGDSAGGLLAADIARAEGAHFLFLVYPVLDRRCGTHTMRAYTDTPKTPESQRYIKIPKESIALLKRYAVDQEHGKMCVGDRWEDTGYVFTGEYGRPLHPDSINGWLNHFSQRHGFRHINPHAFRHSMASILINSGADILSVSRRLGHTKASTTLNFYGHVLQQADAQSSECIADVLLRGVKTT